MNYLRKSLFFLSLLSAALFAEDGYVTLGQNQTIDGDYHVTGRNVEISGHVKGDLYVFGAQVVVDGRVDGDVIFATGDLTLSGEVGGNVRGAAAQFRLNGNIHENVSILAANTDVAPEGRIDGGLLAISANFDQAGTVMRSMRIFSSAARIAGDILGDVHAQVGTLRLTSKAKIGGNLDYSGNKEAYIDPGAEIGGEVIYHPSIFSNLTKTSVFKHIKIGSKVAVFLMNFLYSFVIGLFFLHYYREKMQRCSHMMQTQPLRTLLTGLMVIVFLPIIALMMLMTIVGVPFALTLVAINVIGFYSAKVLFVLWLSNGAAKKLRHGKNAKLFYFASLCIYFGLRSVPIFGHILSLIATLFGLGALVTSRQRTEK